MSDELKQQVDKVVEQTVDAAYELGKMDERARVLTILKKREAHENAHVAKEIQIVIDEVKGGAQ